MKLSKRLNIKDGMTFDFFANNYSPFARMWKNGVELDRVEITHLEYDLINYINKPDMQEKFSKIREFYKKEDKLIYLEETLEDIKNLMKKLSERLESKDGITYEFINGYAIQNGKETSRVELTDLENKIITLVHQEEYNDEIDEVKDVYIKAGNKQYFESVFNDVMTLLEKNIPDHLKFEKKEKNMKSWKTLLKLSDKTQKSILEDVDFAYFIELAKRNSISKEQDIYPICHRSDKGIELSESECETFIKEARYFISIEHRELMFDDKKVEANLIADNLRKCLIFDLLKEIIRLMDDQNITIESVTLEKNMVYVGNDKIKLS